MNNFQYYFLEILFINYARKHSIMAKIKINFIFQGFYLDPLTDFYLSFFYSRLFHLEFGFPREDTGHVPRFTRITTRQMVVPLKATKYKQGSSR